MTMASTGGRRGLMLSTLGALCLAAPRARGREPVLVLAVSNLRDVLDPLAAAFGSAHGISVRMEYGPSVVLLAQLRSGAAAELFLPLGRRRINHALSAGLLMPRTETELARSQLALAAAAGARDVALGDGMQLASLLGPAGRLAIGDPQREDSGRYAEAALRSMEQWQALDGRVDFVGSPGGELLSLARGEAALAVTLDTDLHRSSEARIVGLFPPGCHPPIAFMAALTARSSHTARKFLDHLRSPEATGAFRRAGYSAGNLQQDPSPT